MTRARTRTLDDAIAVMKRAQHQADAAVHWLQNAVGAITPEWPEHIDTMKQYEDQPKQPDYLTPRTPDQERWRTARRAWSWFKRPPWRRGG